MKYIIVNLNNLTSEEAIHYSFDTEYNAIIFLRGMAFALNNEGYKIITVPTNKGISYDTPQYFEATKKTEGNVNPTKIRYALMSYNPNKSIAIEKETTIDNYGFECANLFRFCNENDEYLRSEYERLGFECKTTNSEIGYYIKEYDNLKSEVFIF